MLLVKVTPKKGGNIVKYFIAITLLSMQLSVAPLSAFHYGPEPVEQFDEEPLTQCGVI